MNGDGLQFMFIMIGCGLFVLLLAIANYIINL